MYQNKNQTLFGVFIFCFDCLSGYWMKSVLLSIGEAYGHRSVDNVANAPFQQIDISLDLKKEIKWKLATAHFFIIIIDNYQRSVDSFCREWINFVQILTYIRNTPNCQQIHLFSICLQRYLGTFHLNMQHVYPPRFVLKRVSILFFKSKTHHSWCTPIK